jgi:undecaprenyl-diphosphatase
MPDQTESPDGRASLGSGRHKAAQLGRAALMWIGGHELNVLAALLVLAVAMLAFIKLADAVVAGTTMPFDEWAVKALRQPDDPATPIGPPWLAEVARDITALGGVTLLMLLTLGVAGFLGLKRMYGAMALVLAAAGGGVVVSQLLKSLFDRPRPDLVPHLAHVFTSSFPSGHSMLSAAVFLTLGALLARFVQELRLRAYFLLIAMGLTVMVGLSRVFVGVHYPTDVLAGWSAGLAWALLCWLVARRLQRRGALPEQIAADGEVRQEAAS